MKNRKEKKGKKKIKKKKKGEICEKKTKIKFRNQFYDKKFEF